MRELRFSQLFRHSLNLCLEIALAQIDLNSSSVIAIIRGSNTGTRRRAGMKERKRWWPALAGVVFLVNGPLWGADITIEGGPLETGFNSGTFAYIHAAVHGLTGQPKRYVVFAEIKYYGT